MKPDSERKKRYHAKLHKKRDFLHVHISKELRKSMKSKTRSVLARKGDNVKVMRGSFKGKNGKISSIATLRCKIFIEGFNRKTLRGKEVPVPFEPSNLLLVGVEMSQSRKELFQEVKETKEVTKEVKEVKDVKEVKETKVAEAKVLESRTSASG